MKTHYSTTLRRANTQITKSICFIILFIAFGLNLSAQQGRYLFPYVDPALNSWALLKDRTPSSLCKTLGINLAHAFNSQVRYSETPERWEPTGGIVLTNNLGALVGEEKVYCQGITNAVGKTFFNDIAFVSQTDLQSLQNDIEVDNATWLASLPTTQQDSVKAFYTKPTGGLREGILIIAGAYSCDPTGGFCPGDVVCTATNAALYVVDATTLQPIRFLQFFKCEMGIQTSGLTAIKYLDFVRRFVAVGSAQTATTNADVLAYFGDLKSLVWPTVPGAFRYTNTYDMNKPGEVRPDDFATDVDFRYIKKDHVPQGWGENAVVLISGYSVLNSMDDSFILKTNFAGTPVAAKIKNHTGYDRAHALTFATSFELIYANSGMEVALAGYARYGDYNLPYITRFDQDLNFTLEGTYSALNTPYSAEPGFSILRLGTDDYAITGILQRDNDRQHLFYLRVANNLTPIEHSIYPFMNSVNYHSYGKRMVTLDGNTQNMMIGGASVFDPVFGSCNGTDPTWKLFTQNPLTVTRSDNQQNCRTNISSNVLLCGPQNGCWNNIEFNTVSRSLPIQKQLYEIVLETCSGNYCGQP